MSKGRNKKESEEKVSSSILRRLYKDFPALYTSFRKTKYERGFP